MRATIVENIIAFYTDAAQSQHIRYGESMSLKWFLNKPSHWPTVIVGKPNTENIAFTNAGIEANNMPPFWLTENTIENTKLLESSKFRELMRWEGMWLSPDDFIKTSKKTELTLTEVKTTSQLNNWINIAFTVLMPDKIVGSPTTQLWANSEKYIMLSGIYNNETVCTGLALINEQTAGLYFITTLPQYQKMGFGAHLVSALIEKCFALGANEIILHASSAGFKLYKKLGFQSDGQLSTFWKIGKF
ncbi:MAG TPA: GNAT family N-acetyltransferase [Prolixibacteraceae bacterium]|mgnify:CR=1 FL=1|nr:GNAT family N-acetyltransferase [Prolixibacteraceae bacterium]HPR60075.1 GNAT family N-acetyltransferase [Prolixibacteraceae bacterium]